MPPILESAGSIFTSAETSPIAELPAVDGIVPELAASDLPTLFAEKCEEIQRERARYGSLTDLPALLPLEQQRLHGVTNAVIELLSSCPDHPMVDTVLRDITALWRNGTSRAPGDFLVKNIFNDNRATRRLLEYWKLDPEELFEAWEVGYGQGKLPDGQPNPAKSKPEAYIRENLRCIRELEYTRPHMASGLRRTHRIRNFGRYDPAVLAHMYQNLTTHHAENVVFANSLADHNGAFYKHPALRKDAYDKLIAAGIGVHIVEFDVEDELYELGMAWNAQRPGEILKVIVPSAHGAEDEVHSVALATSSPERKTTPRKIGKTSVRFNLGQLITLLLALDGSVVMNCCNTGKTPDGLAATVRNEADRRTIAPEEAVVMNSLDIDARAGRVIGTNVIYSRVVANGNAWERQPTNTAIFERLAA